MVGRHMEVCLAKMVEKKPGRLIKMIVEVVSSLSICGKGPWVTTKA